MRVLLDEDVPEQVQHVLAHVLPGHVIKHVHEIHWSGKKDPCVFADATGKFDILVTNNHRQLLNPDETAALKKSGLHHVSYEQKVDGLEGLALAVGAIIAAMPMIVRELQAADGQRIVRIANLDRGKRYVITDPRKDPPAYWPR